MGVLAGATLVSLGDGSLGSESIAKIPVDFGGLGFVECGPWHVCLRWPLMVASEEGQCFIALQRARPGKVAQLPPLMAVVQV